MEFDRIYKNRDDYCIYCGFRAKEIYNNQPLCHYHLKKIEENELQKIQQSKKIKKFNVQQYSNVEKYNSTRNNKIQKTRNKITKEKAFK